MIKQISILLLFSMLLIPITYADWPQEVKLCLRVLANDTQPPISFVAKFISEDHPDQINKLLVDSGEECAQHIYKHGPKNIRVGLASVIDGIPANLRINPSASCWFLSGPDNNLESPYFHTRNARETWTFILTKVSREAAGSTNTFDLVCDYWSDLNAITRDLD